MSLTSQEKVLYSLLSIPIRADLRKKAEEIRQRTLWRPAKMEEFRLARCKEILLHAGAHVPYYREMFREHGFDPHSFSSFEDLTGLPILSRDILRNSFSNLQSERIVLSELTVVRTGGTSGEPVRVLLEKEKAPERLLVTHRLYAMMGRTVGSPTLLVAGSPIDFEAWHSLRERLKNRLINVTVHSSFALTPQKIKGLLDEIASRKYRFVIAYASVFDLLANAVNQAGLDMPPTKIIPTAELITDAQRGRWEQTLSAEVFELYGSREMNSIAGETREHDGLVVNGDIYHVEILDEMARPLPHGSPGIVTVTSLIEHGMPLIRYQLGDAGVMRERPLGSPFPFPRLRITHGRVLDVVLCPDGTALPGEFFPHLMKEVSEDVERFQVVQTDTDRLLVRIVPSRSYSNATTSYLAEKIAQRVGSEMRVEFGFVERIDAAVSGKFRPTINLLPLDDRHLRWGQTAQPQAPQD